ncbi:hypothetical protein DNTS_032402 [Danionella cerebrum]|uniref:[histone H3]-lysine(4) N-trimethyltransferase n=1 Tax=Danionella cerebrum TaxID=2873325 RepID=A0A553N145_9TELE|nr:hypothetical protein DNTS_032402 [Danionella translucida]
MKVEGVAGVEQFASPGKGRGLRASRAFGVGELLLSCPAYSYVLSVKERGLICEQCFSRKTGLARCGKCKKAFYCNVNCQKKNWSMHKLECQAMCAFGQHWCPSETVRLVARIIARLRDQRERSPSENLLLLRDMEDHLEDLDNEKRQMIEAHIASLHQFYSKHLDFPEHQALLTLFSQVHCNGFTVEDEELSNLGLAIFPDIALLNHSCSPNVIVTYRGINAEVRAVQSISAGQEVSILKIFTSYIDLLYPCEDRMERLRDMYYFNCDCKDMEKMSVRKLRDEIGEKEIRDMVRYARNAMEDFRRAKHEKNILLFKFFLPKMIGEF